jgi:prolyl-tRNA synthetase
MSAAVELYNDEAGISWPISIAPFHVVVTPVNVKDQQLLEAAERIYDELGKAGLDALLDDRDERAGVKFNDADLIGVPYRITIGKKIKEGKVELFTRATRQSEDVLVDSVVQVVLDKANAAIG